MNHAKHCPTEQSYIENINLELNLDIPINKLKKTYTYSRIHVCVSIFMLGTILTFVSPEQLTLLQRLMGKGIGGVALLLHLSSRRPRGLRTPTGMNKAASLPGQLFSPCLPLTDTIFFGI